MAEPVHLIGKEGGVIEVMRDRDSDLKQVFPVKSGKKNQIVEEEKSIIPIFFIKKEAFIVMHTPSLIL